MYIWKQRNGFEATYSKLIKSFEQAGCKYYADEIRRLAQLSTSETDNSSDGEEHSQVPTYPMHKQQLLTRHSPSMSKPAEIYVIADKENLAEGKNQYVRLFHMIL